MHRQAVFIVYRYIIEDTYPNPNDTSLLVNAASQHNWHSRGTETTATRTPHFVSQ